MTKLHVIPTSGFFLAVALLTATPRVAHAGCVSDCKDDYESEVDSCRSLYTEPDESDDLAIYLDSAESEYDDCVEECTS